MKFYEGENVPIKCWCNNPEQGALDQADQGARVCAECHSDPSV